MRTSGGVPVSVGAEQAETALQIGSPRVGFNRMRRIIAVSSVDERARIAHQPPKRGQMTGAAPASAGTTWQASNCAAVAQA
ncbi:hypothetical protein GCM10011505_21810 [Tistrella bauzanensis]|uniref:Transposase n=1 Tax=Tistrella bauzanensis TaxID=657419 RepID=A0ABQ1IGS4_9PROT|nr:hypothetical protein GCM10011505_21810 [Tistrella bauzanensis]